MEEEYREITLADIVRTLHKRKLVLIGVFLLTVLVGVAVTVFATPEYESTASIIPLEHPDIIQNWLESRRAAERVLEDLGEPLRAELLPDDWDDPGVNWTTGSPDGQRAARALADATDVRFAGDLRFPNTDRHIALTVTLTDPLLARDAADAYVQSLEELRPTLQSVTENRLFAEFYTESGNAQDARARAEEIAQNTRYWRTLDAANIPQAPSSPNVTLNIALSIVLGLMLGVFAVFLWEWIRNFRAEAEPVQVAPAAAGAQDDAQLGRRRRYG